MKTDLKTGLPFEDLGYEERRRQLRYDYMHDAANHKAVKVLAFEIQKKLKKPAIPKLAELSTIIKFLIDGFLAYEIITDESGVLSLDYVELDPISLEPKMIENNTQIWVQYKGTPNERILSYDKILYFSYSSPNNHEISFMQSLIIGLILPIDIEFIKQHAKEIAKKLSE